MRDLDSLRSLRYTPAAMFLPARRASLGLLATLLALTASCGIGGDSRDIPPAPTAAPGGSDVFVYVAEASDPVFGTSGGAVSLYQLGSDGSLPGGPPITTVPAVNPRRLFLHPTLPVLYVATLNQILAFDVTGGALVSLCGGSGTTLAAPCATSPRADANPTDMTVEQSEDGGFVLYVVEQGNQNQLSQITAYPLDPDGGLPEFPASAARATEAFFYLGFAVAGPFGYAADPSRSGYDRFPIQPDGNFDSPAPTPSPQGAPTPSPTPTAGPDPTPVPTASPSFFFLDDVGPAKTIKVILPQPSPDGSPATLYALTQAGPRIGQIPVDSSFNLPPITASTSPTRGIYNELLVVPSVSRIYGAGFQIGQIDSFTLAPNGAIDPTSLATTFANTAQFPTGIAYFEQASISGGIRRTMLVSLGGFARVDAYEVFDDGTLADLPFSSTEPRTGTFPSDVVVVVE
jgi:hypothetical protein